VTYEFWQVPESAPCLSGGRSASPLARSRTNECAAQLVHSTGRIDSTTSRRSIYGPSSVYLESSSFKED